MPVILIRSFWLAVESGLLLFTNKTFARFVQQLALWFIGIARRDTYWPTFRIRDALWRQWLTRRFLSLFHAVPCPCCRSFWIAASPKREVTRWLGRNVSSTADRQKVKNEPRTKCFKINIYTFKLDPKLCLALMLHSLLKLNLVAIQNHFGYFWLVNLSFLCTI